MSNTTNPELRAFIVKDVRLYIAENLTFSDDPDELDADTSMLETDIIDSTSVLELVSYLEERFNLEIEDSAIVPANLDTLNRIAEFVASRLESQPGAFDLEQLSRAS